MYGNNFLNEKYILTGGEKAMLIIIGIVTVVNGLVSILVAVLLNIFAAGMTASSALIYYVVSGIAWTVSGAVSLFRQRWAYIAAEVFFIIDIFVWMNYILSPQGLLWAFIGLNGTAVGAVKIIFCHKCQDALSNFSQTSRRSYLEKRFR